MMEFNFAIKNVASEGVLKIDNSLKAIGHEQNLDLQNAIATIIDEMGKASAVAQELKSPITSAQKLVQSDHAIYVMTEHSSPENFAVVGILKMGWKKLYLYDKVGARTESMVYCLLDFYIHESKQRKGYGKRLLEHMLQDTNLDAKNLAIDKPTKKLLQFMWKHYQLSKLVNQGNNFVIYEEFFDEAFDEKNHENNGNRASSYKRQPCFGRHGAHKHHDTMGQIVQGEGDAAFMKHKYNHDIDFVNSQFQEVNPDSKNSAKRDLKFHHNTLW